MVETPEVTTKAREVMGTVDSASGSPSDRFVFPRVVELKCLSIIDGNGVSEGIHVSESRPTGRCPIWMRLPWDGLDMTTSNDYSVINDGGGG